MRKIILFLILVSAVYAIPPIPTEFYGTVTVYNYNRTPLSIGTQIEVMAGNISCGTFNVQNRGYYGLLSCLGDDTYTSIDEGAQVGQNIIFYLNGEVAQTFGDTVWYSRDYHNVNITPLPYCGNTYCEMDESCFSCAEDCGLCPPNSTGGGDGTGGEGGEGGDTGNVSAPSGGDSTDGGGGGGDDGSGGSGGFGDIGDIPAGAGTGENYTGPALPVCQEDWLCTEWSPQICPPSGEQTRSCEDRNQCGTYHLRPDTSRDCAYEGTCYDNIKNQDETDVDCGGDICESCDLDEECLFDSDCQSGFCDPTDNICKEPTCEDGFKNQGERGVDCDGPCLPCQRPTLEEPRTVTRFIAEGCGPFPWSFVLLASILSLIGYGAGRVYIRHIKHSREYRKLKRIDQLERAYYLDRNLRTFILLVILLQASIATYLYYFCEIAVWIVIMVILIIPLFVAVLMKHYVYDEKRKKKRLRELVLRHEDYIKRLIQVERDEIRKDEEFLFEELTRLDYTDMDTDVALQLKDVRYLIEELMETQDENPFEIENSLADAITELSKYKDKLEEKELTHVYSSLKMVERIHRDIVSLYKSLREDVELAARLEDGTEEDGKEEQVSADESHVSEDKDNGSERKSEDETGKENADTGSSSVPQKDTGGVSGSDRNTDEEAGKENAEGADLQESNGSEDKDISKTAVDHNALAKELRDLSYEDKVSRLKEEIRGHAGDTGLIFMLASQHHKNNNYEEAEEAYKNLLKESPQHKAGLYYLASLYNSQKHFKDAFSLYEKLMGIDPDYMKTQEYYERLKKQFL